MFIRLYGYEVSFGCELCRYFVVLGWVFLYIWVLVGLWLVWDRFSWENKGNLILFYGFYFLVG